MENTERNITVLQKLDMALVTAGWSIQKLLNNRRTRARSILAQGWKPTLPERRPDASTLIAWFYFNGKRNLY